VSLRRPLAVRPHRPEMPCWDFRTVATARRAAKKLGVWHDRRNINITGKSPTQTDWWVELVWELYCLSYSALQTAHNYRDYLFGVSPRRAKREVWQRD